MCKSWQSEAMNLLLITQRNLHLQFPPHTEHLSHYKEQLVNVFSDFDILLTVHLSIIFAINQLNARILVFFKISLLYICFPTNCTQLIYFIDNTLKHMYCLKL